MRAVGLGTGSRHARHQAVARENRRLRQLVSRLRGCLAALDPGARRLLDLRAGVGGPARSARATARILHLSLRREAIRERQALKALTRSGATGCHGQPAAGTPAVATTGLPTLSSSPPSGPTAAKGNTKKMSRASYASNRPSGGSAANISTSRARTEQAGTSGSFPSAYVTALLGLLLALAMVVAPKLRRRPASAMAGGAASSHGGRVNQAVAPGVVDREALAQTAAARRPVTQVVKPTDPAIAPMAADAYASMAADDHSPEAADSDEAASTGPDPE